MQLSSLPSKEATITIKAEKKDSQASINIKDTGPGISPEIKPKLFSKFATNSSGGTGIGLFISKNILEAHGGGIRTEENTDGKGATFTFSLPLENRPLLDLCTETKIWQG